MMINQTDVPRIGLFRRLLNSVAKLFPAKERSEGYAEQRAEEKWEETYKDTRAVNYTEIFASRLTNYALYGASVTADDEVMNDTLKRMMRKARKASNWALAVGRAYLVPYMVGGEVYTDIIPQSRAVVTRKVGDDILGFACLADLRKVGTKTYARWTMYDYDLTRKAFVVENKATDFKSDSEVSLASVGEWADILPYIEFQGVEKPLFGFVDSPKDNRDTDNTNGASITFGCNGTVDELHDNIKWFSEEFRKKVARLGVDKSMLDKGAMLEQYVLPFNSGGMNGGNLFEVFDPPMRDQSYISRGDSVSARLEKQVGTSSGILTPADTSMATATQVRRAMFDTIAMVDAIRESFENAIDALTYAYEVYLGILGKPFNKGYTVKKIWSQAYIDDDMERFNKITQGHSAGVVSDLEYRREIFPNETPEEAEKALEEIEASKPDPFDMMAGNDGGDGAEEPQDGSEDSEA